MTTYFRQLWQQLNESLWFVPSLMVVLAGGLAYSLIELDAHTSWQGEKQFPLLFGVGAEGSRGMLTAIAGSMLTVAALIFSLTLSTISQVSSQYSPRVLRNAMRDRTNQIVMGYFVSVFTYCLIVLGTIRGTDERKFVPATAVLVGLMLALGGVAALIFFIHHIAESLQTGTIVQRITRETNRAIDRLFSDGFGDPVDEPKPADVARLYALKPVCWHPVVARQSGYLQRIDTVGLIKWAVSHRVVLRFEHEIGDFVSEGSVLVSVHNDQRPDPDDTGWLSSLLPYVSIKRHRAVDQDVAFGTQQLVDVALKALSAGINDTTTAIMAVDYLGDVCGQLARRDFPSRFRSDGEHLRIVVKETDFDAYIRLAFDLVRINAKGDHAVLRRLLRVLAQISNSVQTPDRRPVLREQVRLLMEQAEQSLATAYEKKQVQNLHDELRAAWK